MESGNYDSDEGSQDNQIQYPLTQRNNTWWCDICRLYEYNLVSKSTHNNRSQHRKSSEKNKQQQSVLQRAENPYVLGEQQGGTANTHSSRARYFPSQLPSNAILASDRNDRDNEWEHSMSSTSPRNATSFYPFGLTGNTKLIDISWDNIGALFALDSTPRYLSKTNIKGLQTAYNQVFQDIKAKPNDEIEYKKLALLPIILNFNTDNKFVGGKKMSFDYKMKCLLVRNDWSIFTLSLFRGRLKRIHSNDYTENDIDDEIQKLSHQQKVAKFMKDHEGSETHKSICCLQSFLI